MTRDEFIDAVWDEVIAGYPARDILAAWLRYLSTPAEILGGGGKKRDDDYARKGWEFVEEMQARASAMLAEAGRKRATAGKPAIEIEVSTGFEWTALSLAALAAVLEDE